jgi:hypothetical protein
MKKIFQTLGLLFILLTLVSIQAAQGSDLSIVFVRKSIPMSEQEPAHRDLYLSGGSGQGVKKDQIYIVFRKVQVRDASGSVAFGEIEIPVGEIKVISSYDRVAVARDLAFYSRDSYPTLEISGTMAGDVVKLKK